MGALIPHLRHAKACFKGRSEDRGVNETRGVKANAQKLVKGHLYLCEKPGFVRPTRSTHAKKQGVHYIAMNGQALLRAIGSNIFLLGMLAVSQILFEFVLAALTTVDDFEKYVTMRNVALVMSGIAPLGIPSMIARVGESDLRQAISLSVFSVLLVLCFGAGVYVILSMWGLSGPNRVLASLLGMMLSSTLVLSSLFRSKYHFWDSVLIRDGWRMLLWPSLIVSIWTTSYATSVGFTLVVTVGIMIAAYVWKWKRIIGADTPDEGRIGTLDFSAARSSMMVAFSMSAISLTVINYADQLMIDYLSTEPGELKTYSLGFAFIVSPFAMLAYAAGSIFMPLFANKKITLTAMGHSVRRYASKVILVLLVGGGGGYWVVNWVLRFAGVNLDWMLYALLVGIGLARILYTIPSSYIGGAGSVRFINVTTGLSIGFSVVHIGLAIFLFREMGIIGVALSTLLHWLMKVVSGFGLAVLDLQGARKIALENI